MRSGLCGVLRAAPRDLPAMPAVPRAPVLVSCGCVKFSCDLIPAHVVILTAERLDR